MDIISCMFDTLIFRGDEVPSGEAYLFQLTIEADWGLEQVLTFTGAKPSREPSLNILLGQRRMVRMRKGVLVTKPNLLHCRTPCHIELSFEINQPPTLPLPTLRFTHFANEPSFTFDLLVLCLQMSFVFKIFLTKKILFILRWWQSFSQHAKMRLVIAELLSSLPVLQRSQMILVQQT